MFTKLRSGLMLKIIVPAVLILIVSLGASTVITYFKMSGTLDGQMKQFVASNLDSIINQILQDEKSCSLTRDQLYKDLGSKVKALAEIVASNPSNLSNARMTELAKVLDVDEIHITDEKGLIKYSTVAEFVGYDFDSSDQSRPFMQALTDKSFMLVQDPTPRGVDKTLFQYAGAARQDMPGIIQVGVAPKTLAELLEDLSPTSVIAGSGVGEKGFAILTDKTGKIIYHHDKSVIGKNIKELGVNIDLSSDSGELYYVYNGEAKYLQYKNVSGYKLLTTVFRSEFLGPLYTMIRDLLVIELGVVLLGIIATFLIIRRTVLLKIKAVEGLIDKTAKFDLAEDSSFNHLLRSKDEIGVIARAAASMRKALKEIVENIRKQSENLLSSSENLALAANESSASAEEVAHAVDGLAKGASEQAREAQNGSEKLVLLSDEIGTVADKASSIEQKTLLVSEANNTGKKSLENLKERFEENIANTMKVGAIVGNLADKSGAIVRIIETIEDIATLTNLLALNAAIEAARAGDAGKGFAVVADEIRGLSEKTSTSTKEISVIVNDINSGIKESKVSMDITAATVNKLQEGISETEKAFRTMSDAIEETINDIGVLSESVNNVNDNKSEVIMSIQEISAISEETAASTQEVAASVEEQTTTVEDMSATADGLREIAIKLSGSINGFKL